MRVGWEQAGLAQAPKPGQRVVRWLGEAGRVAGQQAEVAEPGRVQKAADDSLKALAGKSDSKRQTQKYHYQIMRLSSFAELISYDQVI